jgi:hypothetical protein
MSVCLESEAAANSLKYEPDLEDFAPYRHVPAVSVFPVTEDTVWAQAAAKGPDIQDMQPGDLKCYRSLCRHPIRIRQN